MMIEFEEESNGEVTPSSNADDSEARVHPDQITLYWMSGQIGSWKVRLTLEEKQLQGYKSILLIRPEQIDRDDPFWINNQYGVVPSLKVQDITLNGVLPILLFLENSMPLSGSEISNEEQALMYERAFETDRLQRICTDDIITPFLAGDYLHLGSKDRDQREEHLFRELLLWDNYLAQQISIDGIACHGFTMADVMFFPELALAVHFGLPITVFPHLKVYYDKLSQRPSISKTWPHHWLDKSISYDTLSKLDRFVQFYRQSDDKSLDDLSNEFDDDSSASRAD